MVYTVTCNPALDYVVRLGDFQGHKFAGDIVEVGRKWQNEFKAGEKFAQQPALNYQGRLDSPGYSSSSAAGPPAHSRGDGRTARHQAGLCQPPGVRGPVRRPYGADRRQGV